MMVNLTKWAAVCLLVGFMVSFTTGLVAAQDAKIVEGILMAVDPNARVLTMKSGEKEMQFSYTDQTELVSPQRDEQSVAVRQGTKLRIYYIENEKINVATNIEITEPLKFLPRSRMQMTRMQLSMFRVLVFFTQGRRQ